MWMFRLADTPPGSPAPAPGNSGTPGPPRTLDTSGGDTSGGGGSDEGAVREEIQNALINVLPWGISAVFHAALVLLAVFVVWTTILRVPDEPVIVPLVNLSQTPGAPLETAEVEKLQERSTDRRTVRKTESRVDSPLQSKLEVKVPIIGVSGAASAKVAPFGATLDAGSQFKSSMFGLGGNARRLVLVIDATGSLLDTFPHVIAELKRTVQELSERQSFTIVFFTGDGVVEVPPPGPQPATSEVKARVIEWIDPSSHNVVPTGKANPVEAIQRALRYKPELIFLLSDNITGRGQYEIDQKTLLNEIERANAANTKINTIQFVYRDPFESMGLPGTMELIAEQSGGLHTFISAEDLGLR